MSVHLDLLQQARRLARLDPNRPEQANLRRAVSSAYYAFFHFLTDQACRNCIGTQQSQAAYRQVIARGFEHSSMKSACRSFAGGQLPQAVARGLPRRFAVPQYLRNVAQTFAELQDQRHLADYDLSQNFARRILRGSGGWSFDQRQACFSKRIGNWRVVAHQQIPSGLESEGDHVADKSATRRVIRVHVSSPEDVAAERAVLDEVVASINRTEGDAHGVHVELFNWQRDAVPRIGPGKQETLREQSGPCDIYLGIMSASFGDGQTKAEFDEALARYRDAGEPWIMFYFDDDARPGTDPDDALQWVEVCKFRKAVKELGIVGRYHGTRGINGFYEKVSEHLRKLVHRLAPATLPGKMPARPADPTKYLRDVQDKNAWIDIRGLQIGTGRTNRFPIEELYISLTTTGPAISAELRKSKGGRRGPRDSHRAEESRLGEQRDVPLHEALCNDRLVVVGQPGAGKTTFLRRIAHALCQTHLGDVPKAAQQRLGIQDRTFPIFVQINELAQHLQRHGGEPSAPAAEAAGWLPHFLESVAAASSWGLDAGFFQQQLEDGRCTVLLDGLDEAPQRVVRERMSRLIEHVRAAYQGCRFVVTSRPAAYIGEVVLPDFAHARIDPLSDQAVETFLSRWCEAVYPGSHDSARAHCDELLGAVRGRVEIRRMARNPVMLTALAVVHWNERRLPQQRADLYESIIAWLSRSREQRAGRETADRTVVLLQELALAMQDDTEGRKTQVPKRWAAEKLAGEIGAGKVNRDTIAYAERFLDEEEVDSGIVVGRGNEVAYWHLTFQEFLAAKAIASRLDDEQHRLLFTNPNRVYLPDWREVVLLLAGALHQQGKAKVDGFIEKMLDGLGSAPALADQARCAGLVGAILRDLEPLDYHVSDPRYHGLLDAVMAIFDRDRSQGVPVEERIAAADALGQAGDPRIDMGRDDYWASLPAGKFLMGAQSKDKQEPNYDPAANDESPVHEVSLDGFRIARYPVTVGQYQQFMADDGYNERLWWQSGGFGEYSEPEDWERQVEYPSRPVVGICWWEAAAYCAWAGCRLPTEAQWERAARGTEGRKHPWGDEEPDAASMNFALYFGRPTPVGIFPLDVTPEGVLDMGGNVWEWCQDGYEAYNAMSVTNPAGQVDSTSRVIRGGSWLGGAGYCRAAVRSRDELWFRSHDVGFRVAAVPLSKSTRNQQRSLERRPKRHRA